jgi:hypothetical protein
MDSLLGIMLKKIMSFLEPIARLACMMKLSKSYNKEKMDIQLKLIQKV